MAYIVMAYIVMAYTLMIYIVMAYIVMAYIVMAKVLLPSAVTTRCNALRKVMRVRVGCPPGRRLQIKLDATCDETRVHFSSGKHVLVMPT